MIQRLALGTAQFGLPYGVANQFQQVPLSVAREILAVSRAAGIDTLDTAIAYGESESRLGELGTASWRIISKLPPIPAECENVDEFVRAEVEGSLGRLRRNGLDALLLHRPADLLGEKGAELSAGIARLKADGLVCRVGVSIYAPKELDGIWPVFRPEIVQAPVNVFDRRLVTSGWLARLHDEGIEVHARSVFLQGILLLDVTRRPAYFDRWKELFQRWSSWLGAGSVSALQGALGYVSSLAGVDRIVVGVNDVSQLNAIVEAFNQPPVSPPPDLSTSDEELITPSLW